MTVHATLSGSSGTTVPTIKLVGIIYKVTPLRKRPFLTKNPKIIFLLFLMKVGKLSNKFNAGRSAWHTTNFCFGFSNTVQHAHVQPLTLSTTSSKVGVLGLGPNSGKLGSTKPGTVSFVWPKPKRSRLDWLCRADCITHKHSKDMCSSVPQRPERSAVRHRPIAAQNCIFIAIIDYLKLWSEEEMILFNKA